MTTVIINVIQEKLIRPVVRYVYINTVSRGNHKGITRQQARRVLMGILDCCKILLTVM